MIDDERLSQMLRAAMRAPDEAAPARDLWPALVRRSEARTRFTSTDLSVAAIVIIVLLVFPDWFWFLAYHL